MIFAGLRDTEEAESYDRQHLELPAVQNALIERIASENPNVVVVLHAGSPVRLPWLGKVKAVLLMGLGGQMVGAATLDLLLGRANPAVAKPAVGAGRTPGVRQFGKRFDSVPRSVSSAIATMKASTNRSFHFGFGLSYTSFAIEISSQPNQLGPESCNQRA